MDFKDLSYHGLKIGLSAIFYTLYPTKPVFEKNLPKPAILVSNHTTYLDPFFIIAALHQKDPIHFVAMPLNGYNILYKMTGQIVLGSNDFYRQSKKILENGRYLGFFPEGERSLSGELNRFHDGAASMAIRTQTPIVPVCIYGAYDDGRKFPTPFRNVEVRFGNAISPPVSKGRKAATDLTKLVKEEIVRLSRI